MFDSYSTPEAFKEQSGYTIDGIWYPRVTKIVGIKAKPALYRYYADAPSFKHAQETTEKSAEEGTLVHEAVEAILLGKPKPADTIDHRVLPAVTAFVEFLDHNNIQTAAEWVERRILHKNERYAGTIDALALINGKFGVLDIKTSQGIYRDYNLQTAAYMDALKSEFQNLQTRWILRIDQIQMCARCKATRRTKGGREKIKKNGRNPCPNDEHEWGNMQGVIEMKE
ncbi:MAG: hypothetical protein V1489_01060, partial [Candidatus Liptonbacteria bacterium]